MKENATRSLTWGGLLALGLCALRAGAQEPTVLKTQKDKDSYAVGADLAWNLKRQGVEFETEALLRGMSDVMSGRELMMTDEELHETLRLLQTERRRKQVLTRGGTAAAAVENAEKGAAFLAKNKTKAGVVCLPSGLQYQVLKSGTGCKPSLTDTIECHFRGTLIDGEEFTGSDPANPVTFKVSEVIPGWKQALPQMPVGSKWRLFIPPELAYGEAGAGRARLSPKIGPNATLIYEVELLAIK